MFIKNKYYTVYKIFIEDRKSRKLKTDFYESHHILPKSMGGSDDLDNLVNLTPREHFFAHLLLSKITANEHQLKMAYALRMMSGISKGTKVINSKQYELSKSIIYKIFQAVGKEYQDEKTLQDNILTEYTDLSKVFERGTCKHCGIRPKAINYVKNNKTFYRSKCEICLSGNNKFKIPAWKRDGYVKNKKCEQCGFLSKFTEQMTVITEKKKYKTICLNCQVEVKLLEQSTILKPLADY